MRRDIEDFFGGVDEYVVSRHITSIYQPKRLAPVSLEAHSMQPWYKASSWAWG